MGRRYKMGLVGANDGRMEVLAYWAKAHPDIGSIVVFGNAPGLAQDRMIEQIQHKHVSEIPDMAEDVAADFVVIGSENDIATGLPDMLRARGIPCTAPSLMAYRHTEGSKTLGSETCDGAGIDCPGHRSFTDFSEAVAYAEEYFADRLFEHPLPVKGDWELGGKGVVVAANLEEARDHLDRLFHGGFPAPVNGVIRVQFQAFAEGRENSFFAAINGESSTEVRVAQDYKLRYAKEDPRVANHGNVNTGGVGAYFSPRQNAGDLLLCGNTIVQRLAAYMAAPPQNMPFNGFIFPGVKGTQRRGRKVLEFGARAPLPELTVLAAHLREKVIDMAIFGAKLTNEVPVLPAPTSAHVCVVKITRGYGFQKARGGQVILGLEEALSDPRVTIFHGATEYDYHNKVWRVKKGGGRVVFVNVDAENGDLEEAARVARGAAKVIRWEDEDPLEADDHRDDIAADEIEEISSLVS